MVSTFKLNGILKQRGHYGCGDARPVPEHDAEPSTTEKPEHTVN